MIKKYGIVLSLFLLHSFVCFAEDPQQTIDQEVSQITRAFSAPNNSSIFSTETLFSGSDIGRKTFHMYRSTAYKLSRPVNYQPSTTDESVSSPMLKITGSTVIVDLNGFTMTRVDTDTAGSTTEQAVGIEIGWSPNDASYGLFNLSEDTIFSTLAQPENVIIRNGTLHNFGIGIVVHAGVKNVTLENITIANCALGIVCAGQEAKKVIGVTLKNVSITSDGTDRSSILAWAQEKLEHANEYENTRQMGYGTENIMILRENPEDSSSGDTVLVYSGIALVHTDNVCASDVRCTNLGYAQTVHESAQAEESATATYGVYGSYCSNVQLENMDVSHNRSERFVSGLYVFRCKDVHASHVVSTDQSILVPNLGALTVDSNFGLQAIGVSIEDCYNVDLDDINVSNIHGAAQIGEGSTGYGTVAIGMYIDECDVLSIKNAKIDYLQADDVDLGAVIGIYVDSTLDTVHVENVSICNADTSSEFVGIYIDNYLNHAVFKNITIANNNSEGVFYGIYVDDDLNSVDFDSINIHENYGDNYWYGFYIDDTQISTTYKNLSLKNNDSNGDAYGVYNHGYTYLDIHYEDIVIENLFSSGTFSHTYGLFFEREEYENHTLDGLHFKNIFINNLSSNNDVYGIYMYMTDDDDGYDIIVRNMSIQDFSIQQLSGNGSAGGIYIELDCDGDAYIKGISILNGSFASCAAQNVYGILLDADGDDESLIEHLHVKNISMHDFNGSYAVGMYIPSDIQSADMQKINIHNITGDGNDAYGIYFDESVEDLSMNEISVGNLLAQNTVYGVYISNVLGADIKNISVQNVIGSNARGFACMGYVKNALLDGLQVSGTRATSATDTTNNLRLEDAHAVTIKNAQCNGLIQDAGSVDAFSIDFVSSDATPSYITLENVHADNGYNVTGGMHGIYFGGASSVTLKNVSACGNISDASHAYGIHVGSDASNFSVDTVQVNDNRSTSGSCVGLFLAHGLNSGSVRNVSACNNQVTGSIPGTYVCGIKIGNFVGDSTYSASGVDIEHITCNGNIGPDTQVPWNFAPYITNAQTRSGEWNLVQSVGLWLSVANAVNIKHAQCNSNGLQDSELGGCTFGILLDGAFDVSLDDVSCVNNSGNALCAGLFVNEGLNISVSNSLFSQNYSNSEHVNVESRMSYDSGAQSINYSKHTITPVQEIYDTPTPDILYYPETIKGTYGIVMDNVETIILDTVQANQNTGFRSFGIQLRSCDGVQIKDCMTNEESASGDLFVHEAYSEYGAGVLQGGVNGSSVDVPVYLRDGGAYAPDVFGTQLQGDQYVDIAQVAHDYLQTVQLLKDAPDSNEIIHSVHNMYRYQKDFVEASILLRSTIAQVRAWGVAIGVQCNNCSRVQIENLISCGHSSQEDSAFGLIFANHCTDCTVRGGQFNYNQAWTDSAFDSGENTIDIMAMNPLWASLNYNLLYDGEFVAPAAGGYGALSLDDVDEDTGRFALQINEYEDAQLCAACGPVAAGIVIGDTSERVHVSDVVCAGNQGNAGQAYGLMHDVSLSSSVQNSQFYQNMTNTCGIAYGLADFTPQSGSLHLGNTAFGNQYDSFVDSNYIVPFNPDGPSNFEFPVKVGYNGNITELANASPYDNVEIRFTYHTPQDTQNMPDGVFADWVDHEWIRDEID